MPQQISVDELARMLAAGEPVMLVDVRQPWEHQTAALSDSMLLPLPELEERWGEIEVAPPGALVVAYCHHGVRSLGAAAVLEANGLGPVASLAGGIDAWSRLIDPKVPRY
jgi:adenylyltransferase/sulfurtransferase